METKRQAGERAAKIAYWAPHIKAWQSSGTRAASYCREHNLNPHQFKYWQYQLAPESKKTSEPIASRPALVELEVAQTAQHESYLDFQTPNGISLQIRGKLSPQQLQQLFSLLSDLPC